MTCPAKGCGGCELGKLSVKMNRAGVLTPSCRILKALVSLNTIPVGNDAPTSNGSPEGRSTFWMGISPFAPA